MDPDLRASWYLNRWRLSDFKGALERAGFTSLNSM